MNQQMNNLHTLYDDIIGSVQHTRVRRGLINAVSVLQKVLLVRELVKFFLYDFAKAEIWYVDEDKRVYQSELRLPAQRVCKQILCSFKVARLVGTFI